MSEDSKELLQGNPETDNKNVMDLLKIEFPHAFERIETEVNGKEIPILYLRRDENAGSENIPNYLISEKGIFEIIDSNKDFNPNDGNKWDFTKALEDGGVIVYEIGGRKNGIPVLRATNVSQIKSACYRANEMNTPKDE